MQELTWEPPSPGPWTQDSAHNPIAQTLIMQELYPAGFNKGFTETFAEFGILLDRLAMGVRERIHLPPATALRHARPRRPQGSRVDCRGVRSSRCHAPSGR